MIKRLSVLICGIVAAFGTVNAQAAVFSFDFTAPVVQFGNPADTYLGSGEIFADEQSPGVFAITGAKGAVTLQVYDEYSFDIDDGTGILYSKPGGLVSPESLVLTGSSGPGFYKFDPNQSYFGISLGEVYAPFGTLTITPVAVAAAVPEPATWALMILGMGAVGFAMRRRKASAATTVVNAA